MNYIWATKTPAAKKRVHVQAFSPTGRELYDGNGHFVAICGASMPFNRSINAPFALGRKVCKHCLKKCDE